MDKWLSVARWSLVGVMVLFFLLMFLPISYPPEITPAQQIINTLGNVVFPVVISLLLALFHAGFARFSYGTTKWLGISSGLLGVYYLFVMIEFSQLFEFRLATWSTPGDVVPTLILIALTAAFGIGLPMGRKQVGTFGAVAGTLFLIGVLSGIAAFPASGDLVMLLSSIGAAVVGFGYVFLLIALFDEVKKKTVL